MEYVSFHIKGNKSITRCPHGQMYYKTVILVGTLACREACKHHIALDTPKRQVHCGFGDDIIEKVEIDDLIATLDCKELA